MLGTMITGSFVRRRSFWLYLALYLSLYTHQRAAMAFLAPGTENWCTTRLTSRAYMVKTTQKFCINGVENRRHPTILKQAESDSTEGEKKVEKSSNSEDEGGLIDGFKRWLNSTEGKEDIKTYFISLFVALLLRFTIVEPRFIPSLSMYPTFEIGDQLAVEKVTKRIKPFYRNEVVVFNPPPAFQEIMEQYGNKQKGKEALIKRIVAIPGDKVEVKRGKLLINDVEQAEPFTAEDANYQFGPVVVPPENVLVLGDNRNQSLDGHIWGFLPQKNVIGRAVFVYWPPWRLGNGGMY